MTGLAKGKRTQGNVAACHTRVARRPQDNIPKAVAQAGAQQSKTQWKDSDKQHPKPGEIKEIPQCKKPPQVMKDRVQETATST